MAMNAELDHMTTMTSWFRFRVKVQCGPEAGNFFGIRFMVERSGWRGHLVVGNLELVMVKLELISYFSSFDFFN